jgi:pyruvate carboxylase
MFPNFSIISNGNKITLQLNKKNLVIYTSFISVPDQRIYTTVVTELNGQ